MELYTLPLQMEYETKYGNKSGYPEIVEQFIKYSRENSSAKEQAMLALCLEQAIAWTSDQIYEYYRQLVDLYRDTIKKLLSGASQEYDAETCRILGAAILRGCDRKLLLSEKYESLGKNLFAGGNRA